MGERGPVGKPKDRKLGHTSKAERESAERISDSHQVEIPEADPEWHPVAIRWFESLARSGQSAFYTNSDWGTAYVLAESMSREFSPQPVVDKDGNVTMVSYPPKGASLAAWLKGMTALLVTEGDRRRAQIELQRPQGSGEEAPADVSELDEYRKRLRSS